jgi:hypothetical protein
MSKSSILSALSAFVAQRPGLEFANYGDRSAYFAEVRSITKDLHDFRALSRAVELRGSISDADILKAAQSAFSGRLTIIQDGDTVKVDYCTGQYFPTEYRKAACSVLAATLWAFWRESGYDTGEKIRKIAKAELSRSIAGRYFA